MCRKETVLLVDKMRLAGFVLLIIFQKALSQEDPETEEGKVVNFKLDKGDKVDQTLAALNVDNTNEVLANQSYRCGVFYAGPKGAKPIKALFVVPKRFPYDCTKPEAEIIAGVRKECTELFDSMEKFITWQTPSRLRGSEFNFGDDICWHLKFKSGIRILPPSKRFPKGIPMGYYFNYCGRKTWMDTEKRAVQNVCCDRKKPLSEYFDCE